MTPTRALLLVRISDDKLGDQAGVGRQEEDGRAIAKRLGWGLSEVIVENDTSAFKRRRIKLPDGTTALRTVRPGFRRALYLLAAGAADGLIVYDLDRLARDPRDLEDLIDIVEHRNIAVTSVTGSLRLATDADIAMSRVMVAIANKSSRDTARRVTRKHEQLAAEGKPGGGGIRSYGYDRTHRHIAQDEAEIIREIAKQVLEGKTLTAIARDLNERAIPTVTGAPWNSRSVRTVVGKPAVAGLRAHRDKVVGPAVWPAILPRDQWEEVCARLADRARNIDHTLKRWLTGVLRCSQCGHMLSGWNGKGGKRYWCATPVGGCGKIAIHAEHAEDEVERQVLEALSQPRFLERMRTIAATQSSDEARQGLAEDEEQLKQLAGMWARKEISFAEYTEARRIIEKRVKESRALVMSSAPRVLRALLSAENVEQGWGKLTPADKREVVLAIVPGFEVLPFDRSKARRFDPERLRPLLEGTME